MLFDSVHLLKCIRNNWINQIDQTLRYPTITTATTGALSKASFSHLKQLYDSEQTAICKQAPGLSYTALHPNNLQRQNVRLVLKVFDDKTVSALDAFAKQTNCDLSGTRDFILSIVQFWKIVNVKNPVKGIHLKDTFCEPILGVNDHKLVWLRSFHDWLCAWEQQRIPMKQGTLSNETMFALKHTVATLIELSTYLLTSSFQYVLLGKFQTDMLEFRFGQYRQMSGANYNVSVAQIIESERKLKLMSIMKLVSTSKYQLTVRDFITSCQQATDTESNNDSVSGDCDFLLQFNSVMKECDDVIIDDAEMSALVFIAGYVGFKLKAKLSCIDCRINLLSEKTMECEFPTDERFEYLSKIDRGGLTWPTDLTVDIVTQTIVVFKCLVSGKHCKDFTAADKQRSILSQIALHRCETVLGLSNKCCSCETPDRELARLCIRTVSNVALNNYTKQIADCKTKSKTLKKLSTYVK